MGQLNIYNIGTGHHRGETNNLLVLLHRDCPARDATGIASSKGGTWKIINDGAGSTDEGSSIGAKLKSIGGNAQGTGGSRGVMNATDAMLDLYEATKPDQVNIVGHSRGAITSVRVATKLFERAPNTPVNLFLVDPVKRMAQGTDFHNREIHPNVYRMMVVVMEDVGDKGLFKVMSLKQRGAGDKKRTHLPTDKFIRMPGSHGTATQVDGPIGQVTYQIARRFLRDCGAPVGPDIWSDRRVCNEYFKVQLMNPLVARNPKKPNDKVRVVNDNGKMVDVAKHSRRDRLDGLGIKNRMHGHAVFVNEHHYALFEGIYPHLAVALDNGYELDDPRVAVQVTALQSDCPRGYELLEKLNLV